MALDLAQTTKERLPEETLQYTVTLRWIYYKKNTYPMAISLLKESSEKLEENPAVHYHHGIAYYNNGEKGLAKREIWTAIRLSQNFEGIEEASNTFKTLR